MPDPKPETKPLDDRRPNPEAGPVAWRSTLNHNRMMDFARVAGASPSAPGKVELAYFGSSAFRVTTPRGLSVLIDPWRNHPMRHWDWYLADMPMTTVDIGVSTHAHFDHDALNRLDAHVLLDRPIGSWSFLDLTITGIPDKHATQSGFGTYDFKFVHKELNGVDIEPPDNPRSWDNCLVVVETGGLRILHWGDNRHDPPEHVWEALGRIDIVLLPVDGSQHVMSFEMTASIIARLKPAVVVPHHYYIWDLTTRGSTLQTVDGWVDAQPRSRRLHGPTATYESSSLQGESPTVDFFRDHVAFDKLAWRRGLG
ncbi:MAG: MBL fold metallo-hydrolase [Proteobacteria bacterium]|nr:MBL fold metallo-hydrolase [Pseudomonadota bacterium]